MHFNKTRIKRGVNIGKPGDEVQKREMAYGRITIEYIMANGKDALGVQSAHSPHTEKEV